MRQVSLFPMKTTKCRTCCLRDATTSVCAISNTVVDADKDFCSKHKTELAYCEICGSGLLMPILVPEGEKYHMLCPNCNEQLSTCSFCRNVSTCAFEADRSSLPKIIQKQIRQGPITSVVTVKNPELVRNTCQKGCPCYDPENDCMRQFHYCKKLKHVYDNI